MFKIRDDVKIAMHWAWQVVAFNMVVILIITDVSNHLQFYKNETTKIPPTKQVLAINSEYLGFSILKNQTLLTLFQLARGISKEV